MSIEVLKQRFDDHLKASDRRFRNLETQANSFRDDLDKIKEDQLSSLDYIKKDIEKIRIRMASDSIIVRMFWVLIGVLAGVVITLLVKFLIA